VGSNTLDPVLNRRFRNCADVSLRLDTMPQLNGQTDRKADKMVNQDRAVRMLIADAMIKQKIYEHSIA